jgi:acyl-CoA synthetase (AMP-forming)/AMP-acid ligase II
MDWYQKRRFGDLADEIAARLPDTEGLVFEQARYTFKQIAQRIDEAAKRSKGAVHSHKLIRNVEERAFRMAITHNDVILNYLPLFHAFGYSEGALVSLITGAKQVITRAFDPQACVDLIEQERVTLVHGFEVHLKGLTEAQEARPRDVSSLRTGVFTAGTHSATPVTRRGARVLTPLKFGAMVVPRASDRRLFAEFD